MKIDENQINIVFACDNNYAQHTAVAMASILLNAKHPEKIKFFVICDEVNDDKKNKLRQTVADLGGAIKFFDIQNDHFANFYVSGELSRTAYYRIDIPNIVDASVQKIIYLDCDLLVYDDIENLWNIDMQGKPLAAVPDFGIMCSQRARKQKEKFIGLAQEKPYFNSGLLIMDVAKWRENHFSEKVLEMAAQNKFPHHDQDALNKIFMDEWVLLPLRWNVIPPVFNLFLKILFNNECRSKAIEAKKNPAIFHYAGGYKPWEYEIHQGFNEKYYEYLKKTAFKNAVMPQFDARRKNRSILRQMIRLKIANFWAKIFGE